MSTAIRRRLAAVPAFLLTALLAACGTSEGDAPDASGAPTGDGGVEADAGEELLPRTSVTVGEVFAPGTRVRDAYTGRSAEVADDGTVSIAIDPRGVALLELDRQSGAEAAFSWDNATVYFALTDRFFNGNPRNDRSYGRQPDGDREIGTWHGGDFAGLTAKLDHLEALGVNALWISAPYEQVHGWVAGGGRPGFQHYAYAGYWALDFTKLDANYGTADELRALVREAHGRGIRVLIDVVMNHPGYATGADLLEYLPEVIDAARYRSFTPPAGGSWNDWNQLVNYSSEAWVDWWGPRWIRAGFPRHSQPGQDERTRSLTFLPDFITEDPRPAGFPTLLRRKTDTAARELSNGSVRQYLVTWLAAWVRDFGFDGFRCDTAKHVDLNSWKALKDAGTAALREYKRANPSDKLDDLDFWMVGEVFPHGVVKDEYFTQGGFDALINFDFQRGAKDLIVDYPRLDDTYLLYAQRVNSDPTFNVMSYVSSHDTTLFFETTRKDMGLQYRVGTALMLTPGAVQVYYGDETARAAGPSDPADVLQGTRSDMNWDAYDPALLAHWQKLGQFRERHRAVGAGAHRRLTLGEDHYAFARTYEAGDVRDSVVVVLKNP
jgi:alpha-amylase